MALSALLLCAVWKHTDCLWVLLYVERWFKDRVQLEDPTLETRENVPPHQGITALAWLEYALSCESEVTAVTT